MSRFLLYLIFLSTISVANAGERTMNDLTAIITSKQTIAATPPTVGKEKKKAGHSGYGITLLFSDTCPHCERFAPILMDFANTHDVPVTAYSLTGRTLPSIPRFENATPEIVHHFYQGRPVYTPAIFLINEENPLGRYIHLGTGEMSSEKLNWAWSQANNPAYLEQLQ